MQDSYRPPYASRATMMMPLTENQGELFQHPFVQPAPAQRHVQPEYVEQPFQGPHTPSYMPQPEQSFYPEPNRAEQHLTRTIPPDNAFYAAAPQIQQDIASERFANPFFNPGTGQSYDVGTDMPDNDPFLGFGDNQPRTAGGFGADMDPDHPSWNVPEESGGDVHEAGQGPG